MSRKPTRIEGVKYPNIAHLEFPPRIEDAKEGIERQEVERFYTDQGQPVPKAEGQEDRDDGYYQSVADAPEHIQREYEAYHDQRQHGEENTLLMRNLRGHRTPKPSRMVERESEQRDKPDTEYELEATFRSLDQSAPEARVPKSDREPRIYENTRIDRAYLEAQRTHQAEKEYNALRARARDMHAVMPEHERRIMDKVKDAPADVQEFYKEQIIVARIKELQVRDFEHQQKALDQLIIKTTRANERRDRAEAYKEAERELSELPRTYAEIRNDDMVQADEQEVERLQKLQLFQNTYDLERDEPERER